MVLNARFFIEKMENYVLEIKTNFSNVCFDIAYSHSIYGFDFEQGLNIYFRYVRRKSWKVVKNKIQIQMDNETSCNDCF